MKLLKWLKKIMPTPVGLHYWVVTACAISAAPALAGTPWSQLFPNAGPNDVVVIEANQSVTLDSNTSVQGIVVKGALNVADSKAISLNTKFIVVLSNGLFEIGTENDPHDNRFILTLDSTNNSLTVDLGLYSNLTNQIRSGSGFLMAMGKNARINIYGADGINKKTWTQLAATAKAGSTSLQLADATGWKVGEKIAIASSDFDPLKAEEFTVKAVTLNGKSITLDRPLQFDHYGQIEQHSNGRQGTLAQSWSIDMRAEVARLSSNITIQGAAQADTTKIGGHTMVMDGAQMHIFGAEFYRLGQEGFLGRYPLHWHLIGNASGQFIKNSIIHRSYNKGIAVHGTQNTNISNNVVYNSLGHSYFFEDGAEFNNHLESNLGFSTRQASSLIAATIPSDFLAPTTFWIKNPNNVLINNHAAGSDRHGFWYLALNETAGLSASTGLYNGLNPSTQPLGISRGNVSHSNIENNMMIGATFNEELGAQDGSNAFWMKSDIVLEDLTLYKGEIGIWTRNNSSSGKRDQYINIRSADNLRASFFLGNSDLRKSVVVGRSKNDTDASLIHEGINFRLGQTWYDGKHDVFDSHFSNFNQPQDAALSNARGLGKGIANAISGITLSDVPYGQRFSGLEKGIISDTATIAKFIVTDLDGSVLSAPGAKFTPEYVNLVPKVDYDMIRPGMNAAPGAIYIPEWNGFDNPANVKIAVGSFTTDKSNVNLDSFRVTRSDNNAQMEFHAGQITNPKQTWILQMLNRGITYQFEFLNKLPQYMNFTVEGAADGDTVTHKYLNMPATTQVTGAQAVTSLTLLNQSAVDAYFRQGSTLFIRIADNNGYRITFP
jgi:hypothetical protein